MTTRHYRSEDGISGYEEGDLLVDDTTGEHSRVVRTGTGLQLEPATMTETVYSARYSLPDTADESARNTVSDCGEQTLADIIETCQATGARATLHDAAGFRRGWVHADGSYRLR